MYMIAPVNHEGLEDQAWIQDFLTDKELDELASMCKRAINNSSITSEAGLSQVNSSVRSTSIKWLDYSSDTAQYYKKLTSALYRINEQYFKFDLTGIHESIQLGYYSAELKAFYNYHQDASLKNTGTPRKLSMCLLLNDPNEFEGGDLVIKHSEEELVLEQKKGRAWLFPSYALHKVTPVTKGVRKSLVIWAGGPQFR